MDNYVKIDEENVTESTITCEYEGLVEVGSSNLGYQSVATNTLHIPHRNSEPLCLRAKDWRHAAKQYLSEEDRVDKRGPKQGTREDRTKRMVNNIKAYHCRQIIS